MCLGLNAERASMLGAEGRNECRDQRVTKSGKSGLMAQVIGANRRLDKPQDVNVMLCSPSSSVALSDGFGQQCFSNDFLDILEVTGERAGSNPCFGCTVPVSLVCAHLEPLDSLGELHE